MSTVDIDRLTLPQQLRHWAATRPGDVALRQKDFGIWEPVTWAGYEQAARHFGLGLVDLGLGEGGEQKAPLGRAVIGGLVFATFATLMFVPVVFSLVHRRPARREAASSRGVPNAL